MVGIARGQTGRGGGIQAINANMEINLDLAHVPSVTVFLAYSDAGFSHTV